MKAMSNIRLGLARNVTSRIEHLRAVEIPTFLCPALLKPRYYFPRHSSLSKWKSSDPAVRLRKRSLHSIARTKEANHGSIQKVLQLPQQCAGCGALSQTFNSQEPGFYSLSRRSVKAYLTGEYEAGVGTRSSDSPVVEEALRKVDSEVLRTLKLDMPHPGEDYTI
jgi:hypothetical protein